MPPSMEEGAPIISARALRWSDEEVSFVCACLVLIGCRCMRLVFVWALCCAGFI